MPAKVDSLHLTASSQCPLRCGHTLEHTVLHESIDIAFEK